MFDQPLLLGDSCIIPGLSAEVASVRQHLISFTKDTAGILAEFKVGVRSLPYLADHGFQDMIVLPGSFYVELALCVHVDLLMQMAGTIKNVGFHNPVMLQNEDIIIRVEVVEHDQSRREYFFYE